ncbi:type II toxin-antitoxin system prevent-host-death family antitoxin [Candidatus Venteria ishoeyi]|uniref:type II toxin-antitoxin system Phd/YefM family antitoxin n=1 Tax=Candidatus Venteria ishoeyi TaxID=1899563 RepID=UPI0025A5A741|nr:type II toxin-antitoxin system prevent-host-death family antitoxin [Candidatus Venteria ishoeyi]MDM8545125.1 type II toxin-antitoxin system prevent-host-death family antitoxin [Candidatus Venteria ishoeyi]
MDTSLKGGYPFDENNHANDAEVNMTQPVPIAEAQQHFTEILNRVWKYQEEIIIEQAGKQVVRLSPINEKKQQASGKLDFRKAAGLGAEIWQDIDVENYVKNERMDQHIIR